MYPFTKSNSPKTGLIMNPTNIKHKCEWDENYPENPSRFTLVKERLEYYGIPELCKQLEIENIPISDLELCHSKQLIDNLKRACDTFSLAEQEAFSSEFNAIFVNKHTYNAAVDAVSCAVTLVSQVMRERLDNGFALIRPPGHHAMRDAHNGYCFFNNAAIAAKIALKEGVPRVFILDLDVHHGQATQEIFYEDDRVLYLSVHRYEKGEFWPNLRQSDSDHIGHGKGTGFNVNVELNRTGMSAGDYIAIFDEIVMPLMREFKPDLTIVSLGFDALIGDAEGEMSLTPLTYGHLIQKLCSFHRRGSRLAVLYEGGYNVELVKEAAPMVMWALLGRKLPELTGLKTPSRSVLKSIDRVKSMLRGHWRMWQNNAALTLPKTYEKIRFDDGPYETRNCYPFMSDEAKADWDELAEQIRKDALETFGKC